jgi:hypothetical protein
MAEVETREDIEWQKQEDSQAKMGGWIVERMSIASLLIDRFHSR